MLTVKELEALCISGIEYYTTDKRHLHWNIECQCMEDDDRDIAIGELRFNELEVVQIKSRTSTQINAIVEVV